ncbi:MAG: hypothetical protein AB1782_03870 [Cyanobacteriota bacterium]
MLKKLRTLFYNFAGIDQFDNDFTALSNIKPISNSEKKAQQIIKRYPHLKMADVLKNTERELVNTIK